MEKGSNNKRGSDDSQLTPPAKKQTNIANFFGGSVKPVNKPTANVKQKRTISASRTLQVATAEKWKQSSRAKYSAHDWLVINPELTDKKLVASMICKLCRQFEDHITSAKGFVDTWLKTGSRHLQLYAAVEHAESEAHKRAFDLHLVAQSRLDYP